MHNSSGLFQYYNQSGIAPEELLAGTFAKHIYLCVHRENERYKSYLQKLFSGYGQSLYIWSHVQDLSRMDENTWQLYCNDILANKIFVVCVSSEFMRQDDISWTEFRMAKQLGMLILPIIFDEKEYEKFNKYSDNLQVLEIDDKDTTKIPFEEKLHRYLKSVFGIAFSKEREKQASVFDARLVISYRKKDRKFVRPILEAIHAHPDLQWVGVWYDESMRLGEDYESQIRDEFGKADMALLLVTDNLLEKNNQGKDNYVAAIEYPFICESKIPLIAIGAGEPDESSVSKYFVAVGKQMGKTVPPVPAAVPLNNPEMIAEKIKEVLDSQGVLKDHSSVGPEEAYFLGMAYQSEYLVEQSPKLAEKYLILAAAAGKHEAFEQLATNYKHGIGVERNIDKAKGIQENYVKFLLQKKKIWDNNDEADAITALRDLCELQDMAPQFNDYQYCRILVEICEEIYEREHSLYHELRVYEMKQRYAKARMRSRIFSPIGDGLEGMSLKEIYEDIYSFYINLGNRVQQGEIKKIGVNYLIGHSTIPCEELSYLINKGYLEAMFCRGRLGFLFANVWKEKAEGIREMERVIRLKWELVKLAGDRWAYISLRQDYECLIRLLDNHGIYKAVEDFSLEYQKYLDGEIL